GKPYDNRGRGNTSGGRKQGNGYCYKCGGRGHMSYECSQKMDKPQESGMQEAKEDYGKGVCVKRRGCGSGG
ncbi:hypothetical protein A2U01_0072080, partial [Trifolium medium]|nr:hypothetical protein [Trifolium medium]